MRSHLARPLFAASVALIVAYCVAVESLALAHEPVTTLYFVRHGETQRRLVATGTGTFAEVCTVTRSCCDTPLNPLGVARRDALSDWFVRHGITNRLTHLIATNKPRTVETLAALAVASGLGGDRDGDGVLDGADVDLVPGDGIQQYPADVRECDPGFETTAGSKPFIVDAILALPRGSEAVVAKEDGSTTRVRNFNDLWVVRLPTNDPFTPSIGAHSIGVALVQSVRSASAG
jgi:hypothetical protein